jgi:cyclopropane-fatty-acyl-phospholipid synthase
VALIDHFLSRFVKRGELTVVHADGSRQTHGAPDPSIRPVTLRFTDKGAANFIARHPDLGAGEAFMEGRMVVEDGDILDLLTLIKQNDRWEDGAVNIRPTVPRRAMTAITHRVNRINMAARARRNVAHHYDLSRRLYDLFLDADRQYSCAYYTDPANTLEQAQADKKAHIAAKLALRPEHHVLDIGCGWGGMALYLHEKFGCRVTGITLSTEQLALAREAAGVADKVKFELIDYRAVSGQFDRIVSVGMFEHVGPAHYPAFFAKCRELLTEQGVMLLHTIGRVGGPGLTDGFTAKYIFPGGYNPALSEIVRAYEDKGLMIADIEVLRLHYAHTLQAWYDRTVAAKAEIVALYDERFYRLWTFYLAGALTAFSLGSLVNYQLQFTRDRHELPITRDYMLAGERALE